MKTTTLGYPRIGAQRELKKSSERYWANKISLSELKETGKRIRRENWLLQQSTGIDLIPSNDFSMYDQMLDMCLTLGSIPHRFSKLQKQKNKTDLYFAMARGIQTKEYDIKAMEMTKWMDSNYHYIVPEFEKTTEFLLSSDQIIDAYLEALELGIQTKPVIIGPVTFLLFGKEKTKDFCRLDLLDRLLPVYLQLMQTLVDLGVENIQIDEPCLATDLNPQELEAIQSSYSIIQDQFPNLKIYLASYFAPYGDNLNTVLSLPIHALHLDLSTDPHILHQVLNHSQLSPKLILSLGLVNGRNIWINDFEKSLTVIQKAIAARGEHKIWLASSCSLLHCPYDIELETSSSAIPVEIKPWLAFAKQKIQEIATLKQLASGTIQKEKSELYSINKTTIAARKSSKHTHNSEVKSKVSQLSTLPLTRTSSFPIRQAKQNDSLKLPFYPTTSIGSFPQTKEVRSWRAKLKKKQWTQFQYDEQLRQEIVSSIKFQEEIGLDVLVHGEYERNDMVEYFGERLNGFTFSQYGWVQSYGSRCVKPPIIFGDIDRPAAMTLHWTIYAQSLTQKPVKGMLTGPVTILQWSFVRDDQARSTTCQQIALALRDEVEDLEKAGIKIIQMDEPALREGLPLRKSDRATYLHWAVDCFRIATSGVKDETQIHSHMCYSKFNDIIEAIARLDADVITIEASRSSMTLLDAFVNFEYPNDIGPGVYDIHSPRIPSVEEMQSIVQKIGDYLPKNHIWVNPDCGLKTRDWPETKEALKNMVAAASQMRQEHYQKQKKELIQ